MRATVYRPLTRSLLAFRRFYKRGFLRNASGGYSVAGTPVEIKVGRKQIPGVIERQLFGGVRALFKVKLKTPIAFGHLADMLNLDRHEEDKLFKEYERLECLRFSELKTNGKTTTIPVVTCMWARWSDLRIPHRALKKGMPIEIVLQDNRHPQGVTTFPVRFIKWMPKKYDNRKVPLVWFPEPMTFYDIDKIYLWTMVRPEHISKFVPTILMSIYRWMWDRWKAGKGPKPPPGRRARLGRMRFINLKEPVTLKWLVDNVLRPRWAEMDSGRYPVRTIWSTLLAMATYHMAPILPEKFKDIRPMREDLFYGLVIPAEAAFEGLT